MKKISFLAVLMLFSNIIIGQSEKAYLSKVLNNLNQIKSATYDRYMAASAPYDTLVSRTYNIHMTEYINPSDTFVGASYAQFLLEDSSKMIYFYDGKVKCSMDWDTKIMSSTGFQNNQSPFRIVYPPFFTQVKSLINYTLETSDSIKLTSTDLGDSVLVNLTIYNKLPEVVGNRIRYAPPMDLTLEIISIYDIWINKSDDLPYRLRKKFPDRMSWETCKNITINKLNTSVFIASDYIPADFVERSNVNMQPGKFDLLGKVAPDWILKDADNKTIAFKELKSKVIIIQFTGVGCGPCHASIPFLKQLVKEYQNKDFEFISIESWETNPNILKRYSENNGITYKVLLATKEMKKKYPVEALPSFLILDKDRVIRKVVEGYGKGTTDKEIRDAINELL